MPLVRRTSEATRSPPPCAPLADAASCLTALSLRKAGRSSPRAGGGLDAAEFAVELRGELREAVEIGLGVGGILDEVVGVEELGRVDVGAGVLADDVGRIAPPADRDVAIGQRIALEPGAIGALHDLQAGARRRGEGAEVERVDRREVGADHRREAVLPGLAAVAEQAAERGARALVDVERGRAFGRQRKVMLGDGVEQRLGAGLVDGASAAHRDGRGAAAKRGAGHADRQAGKRLAARQAQFTHLLTPLTRRARSGSVRPSGNCRRPR